MRIIMLSLVLLSACLPNNDVRREQRIKASQAYQNINFEDNNEIDNIVKRQEMFSKPGVISYIVLFNQTGQPIKYTTVKGKVTSSGKRLSNPTYCPTIAGSLCPNDDGTFGSSDSYIYFWTESGEYVQWDGAYLLSDKPIRLSIPPLVLEVESK